MGSRLNLLIGERRRSIVGLAIGSIVSGLAEAATIAVIAVVASSLIKGSKRAHVDIAHLHLNASVGTLIWIAAGLALLRIALQVPLSILPARIASGVQSGMRKQLFHAYSEASWGVQSRDREGRLQETMTGQVMQATGGAVQTTMLINSTLSFLILMAFAVALNVLAAIIVGATTALLFGLLRPLRKRGVRYSRGLSQAQVAYAGGVAESIRLAEETHVFGVAAAQRARLERSVKTYNDLFYRAALLTRLSSKLYESLIMVLLVVAVAGLYLVGGGRAASLGGVVLLLLRAGSAGQTVQGAYQGIAQSLPFIERTQETMRRYLESSPQDRGQALARVDRLEFQHVSFAYNEGQPVLADISFEINAGEVIGIIGPSGAGKSTLVQLLLRLRTPDEGSYVINGQPADDYAREDWNRQVSYVPQEPRLLHASVAENIRFFRELDDEAVERAGRLARIHDDVMSWASGYDTIVGPRADAVSGGQQQRICLARALAARPEVLVLDEPTSALDPNSEALIQQSLTGLKHELTLFIIAHRMSTLDICDRVMVVIDGQLSAFDTLDLLQRNNSYYRSASSLASGMTAGRH
jgi:ATP-binding cassette subfamily B protein